MKVKNTNNSSPDRCFFSDKYITKHSLSAYINIVHESKKNTENYSSISDVLFLRLTCN